MAAIAIDRVKCIKCGKCVKVCPSLIFRMEKPGAAVEVCNPETCIVCGHCVAVCPTDAVIHESFPGEKVHRIDRTALPSPEQVLLLIRSRRSNRAFSKKPVPAEYLDLILEAAHRAPTATNAQNVEFTLVTQPHLLHEISRMTIDILYDMAKMIDKPVIRSIVKWRMPEVVKYLPVFSMMKERFESGSYDPVLRGATSVLFIHAPRESRFGAEDCNLAYQNGSLMAESLGVNQFYTGFVCNALRQDKKHRIEEMLGINGKVYAGMALGMPLFEYPNYIDKKDIKVNKL